MTKIRSPNAPSQPARATELADDDAGRRPAASF
jgi:hypothetical protein